MEILFPEIEYFLKLAECLSFTLAAEELYISQPGLSKTIAKLENKLGVKLFVRSTRSVQLTREGERFYNLSKGYISQCNTLNSVSCSDQGIGYLQIDFANFVDFRYFPSLLETFQMRFPGITVSTSIQNAEQVLNAIEQYKTDIGVMSSFSIRKRNVNSLQIAELPFQAVFWHDHPLAGKGRVSMKDLQNESFIFMQQSINKGGETIVELCKKSGFVPNVVEMASDFNIMFLRVAQKKGITFNLTMPDVDKKTDLSTADINLDEYPEFKSLSGISLVWSEKPINSSVNCFIDTARIHLRAGQA